MADGVYPLPALRARAAAEQGLDKLLDEIDFTAALERMANTDVYFGVYCGRCRQDTVPMPDGRCGWCGSRVAA